MVAKIGQYIVQSREQKRRLGQLEDPVVSAVDDMLYRAIADRASDIHVHFQPQGLAVRFRIDGVLHFFQEVVAAQAAQVLARFKVLANLDVTDARLPQDGKCAVVVELNNVKKVVDLRFATMPSVHGEKLLIRILDVAQHFLSLNSLGLSAVQESVLLRLMQLPYGLILTTGPTGSGKTTTLYALMATIDPDARHVITLEDPVEYSCDGIVQTQINTKIGFSFEQGLRAMLRQDPDVMMIGEIRDRTTAKTALEAALTGHLVLSTLHTRDAVSSLVRLREMGIDNYLLTAALTAVVGQRIVRRLCEQCKVADQPLLQEQRLFEQLGKKVVNVWRPRGCDFCFGSGYFGRIGIYEICLVTEILRDGITKNFALDELSRRAQEQGCVPFIIDGLDKVMQGVIAMDELMRVMD